MRRPLLLAVVALLSLCALARDAEDAGAASREGGPDAGLRRDGGVARPDAGPLDAGPPPPLVRPRWSWVHGDGGWLLDGGVTDILVVSVGETAEVRLPHPIILMQCDEQLLGLSATEDTLLLKGEKAGHSQCGFWWFRQAWPNRMMDVTVLPAP